MNYDICFNSEVIAMGLSQGELNQWILDLDNELKKEERDSFRRCFDVNPDANFEEFIYENLESKLNSVLSSGSPHSLKKFVVSHGDDVVFIVENDF